MVSVSPEHKEMGFFSGFSSILLKDIGIGAVFAFYCLSWVTKAQPRTSRLHDASVRNCSLSLPGKVATLSPLPAFLMLGGANTCGDRDTCPKNPARLDPSGKQWVSADGGSSALSYPRRNNSILYPCR